MLSIILFLSFLCSKTTEMQQLALDDPIAAGGGGGGGGIPGVWASLCCEL
jgi:hypothetical protein